MRTLGIALTVGAVVCTAYEPTRTVNEAAPRHFAWPKTCLDFWGPMLPPETTYARRLEPSAVDTSELDKRIAELERENAKLYELLDLKREKQHLENELARQSGVVQKPPTVGAQPRVAEAPARSDDYFVPETHECFPGPPSSADPDVRAALEAETLEEYPPDDRVSAKEFLARASGLPRQNKCRHLPRNFTMSVEVNPLRRTVYIDNLKSGSSLLEHLQSRIFGRADGSPSHKKIAGNLVDRINEDVCPGRACFAPFAHSPKVGIMDIPEEVMDKYFVYSFSRDPMERMVSSWGEINAMGFPFIDLIESKRHVQDPGRNPHYFTQIDFLTRRTKSGKRLRIDFLGELERFDEDWARLRPAIDPMHRDLSPAERAKLVLARNESARSAPRSSADHHEAVRPRPGHGSIADDHHYLPTVNEKALASFQKNNPRRYEEGSKLIPWSQWHVILICRRYVQDFVCLDRDIPKVCADHADLVLAT